MTKRPDLPREVKVKEKPKVSAPVSVEPEPPFVPIVESSAGRENARALLVIAADLAHRAEVHGVEVSSNHRYAAWAEPNLAVLRGLLPARVRVERMADRVLRLVASP